MKDPKMREAAERFSRSGSVPLEDPAKKKSPAH